jgi:hypothetical protein
MDCFIHKENLALFRKRLAEAEDDATRRVILKLLAEEEAKDSINRDSQGDASAGRRQVLRKPRRPGEKRTMPLRRVTYSISEFRDMTGLSAVAVLRSIDDGTLRTVKIGRPVPLRSAAQSTELGETFLEATTVAAVRILDLPALSEIEPD